MKPLAIQNSLWYIPNHIAIQAKRYVLEEKSQNMHSSDDRTPILPEEQRKASRKEGPLSFVFEIVKVGVIALAIIIPIRYFIIQPFFVRGDSMLPTLTNGDYLIIDEISYDLKEPVRGDIIIFRLPSDPKQFYVKRIIGLPSETVVIRDNAVTIQNEANSSGFTLDESYLPEGTRTPGDRTTALKDDEYFVMGDNRTRSSDSRSFGGVPQEYIVGKAWVRAWPFSEAKAFSEVSY